MIVSSWKHVGHVGRRKYTIIKPTINAMDTVVLKDQARICETTKLYFNRLAAANNNILSHEKEKTRLLDH